MTPQEHYERAELLLNEGVIVVKRISDLNDERQKCSTVPSRYETCTKRMDELGKKAMGIWAQAQVHATLASSGPLYG